MTPRLVLFGKVLQMELMFSKLASLEKDTTQLATNGMDASNHDVEEDTDEVLRMEPVAVQRFEASLSGGHWGIHGYVPVTFSGVHFVRVDCMVRCASMSDGMSTRYK